MSFPVRIFLAVPLAMLPGVWAWWSGRALREEDPLLPERLLRWRWRTALASWTALLGSALLAPAQIAWLWSLTFVALLAGHFSVRRRLLRETWGFPRYVAWRLRMLLLSSFWILLAVAPAVVAAIGESSQWGAAAAAGLTAVLLIWAFTLPALSRRLIGVRPMEDLDLLARCETVRARSRVRAVDVLRGGPRGGLWATALAMPSLRRPAVFFSDTLLELLAPEEIGAVFAHEVAHLEHYDRQRLRRDGAILLLLVVLACAVVPLLGRGGAWSSVFLAGWPIAIVAVLLRRRVQGRQQETASDLRSVELGGDPEALAQGLTKLYTFARLPRRWAASIERRATHPSLARRIQAIRRAAGLPSPQVEPLAVPVLGRPGEWIVFDRDRICRLAGVAASAAADDALDPSALVAAASSVQSTAYGELTELRVAPSWNGRVLLLGRDGAGKRWSVPLDPTDVRRVQLALDAADTALQAPPSGALAVRLLAMLVFALAAVIPVPASLGLPALLVIVWPRTIAALAALGVSCLVAVGLAVRGSPRLVSPFPGAAEVVLGLLIVLGASLLRAAWARARVPAAGWATQRSGRVALALGLGALGALIALAAHAGGEDGLLRLHRAALALPATTLLLAAAGTALLVAGGRRRVLGALVVAATAVPLSLSSTAFLERVVPEPLRSAGPAPAVQQRFAVERARAEIALSATGLRLSPAAGWYSVGEDLSNENTVNALPALHVGRFDGAAPQKVPALDLQWLGEADALVLVTAAEGLELRRLALPAGDSAPTPTVVWSRAFPALAEPHLFLDPGGRFRVVGTLPSRDVVLACSGIVGEAGEARDAQTRFALPQPKSSFMSQAFAAPGTGMLMLRRRYESGSFDRFAHLGWLGRRRWSVDLGPPLNELLFVKAGTAHRLAASRASVSCADGGLERALCMATVNGSTTLWAVDLGNGALTPLARLAGSIDDWAPSPGRLAFEGDDGQLSVLELGVGATPGKLLRLRRSVPAEDLQGLALAGPVVGEVRSRSEGHSVVVLYDR
jgi:Zn-dependent protease with chaperone function